MDDDIYIQTTEWWPPPAPAVKKRERERVLNGQVEVVGEARGVAFRVWFG